jgi:hypothetical protein
MTDDLEPLDPRTAKEMYLDNRRHELSSATIQAHHYRLKQFVRWCEDEDIEIPACTAAYNEYSSIDTAVPWRAS